MKNTNYSDYSIKDYAREHIQDSRLFAYASTHPGLDHIMTGLSHSFTSVIIRLDRIIQGFPCKRESISSVDSPIIRHGGRGMTNIQISSSLLMVVYCIFLVILS